jgi:site-specific DNA-cytosine methylase
MRYFSMFSGIGGFEKGIEQAYGISNKQLTEIEQDRQGGNRNSDEVEHDVLPTSRTTPLCVGYSEIDKYAIKVYERNFNASNCNREYAEERSNNERTESSTNNGYGKGRRTCTYDNEYGGHTNYGDATTINAKELPDFDLLVGGFPCQAFSIAGKRQGFNDTRGTLFFDIARILAEKRPRHLVLENVKGLLSHEQGKTFQTILGVLSDLGYRVEWQVLNSKDFGVPQNRERIYFVGHLRGECSGQVFPITGSSRLSNQSDGQGETTNRVASAITKNYHKGVHSGGETYVTEPRIRRLTPKECERLQGFPDDWTKEGVELCQGKLCDAGKVNACLGHFVEISDTQRYKMAGNAVTVNTVQAVMEGLINEH